MKINISKLYSPFKFLKFFAIFIFVTFFALSITVTALASASWTATGSFNQLPRYGVAGITLPNGKVLIGGGNTAGGADTSDSELYDPSTGVWTTTGSMTTATDDFSMVLLQDGTVFASGGVHAQNGETYDPSTGVWTATANSASQPHWNATVTVLTNGKVLLAGGSPGLANTDIYDPTTRTFTAGPNMTTVRSSHVAVLLPNGKVLLAGGDGPIASAELYDPSTNTFTATGSMNVARSSAGIALLSNGKVLVAGGDGVGTAELYDPSTGTWSMTGSMAYNRGWGQSTGGLITLSNGNVLAAGNDSTGTSEEYDPTTGTWSTAVNMVQKQCNGAGSLLSDGRVILAGGFDCVSLDNKLSSAQLYSPAVSPTPTPTPAIQIEASPATSTVTVGTPFNVTVSVNGSGTAFNAAKATVEVSSNLSITGFHPAPSPVCNLQYTQTPSASNPSFAGGIFGTSSTNCNVYTLTLTPLSAGTGTVTFTNASIKSYANNSEILTGVQNGSYTISGPTPTPTPTGLTTTTIDDSVQGTGSNQWNFTGSGWGHCTSCNETNPTVTFYNAS